VNGLSGSRRERPAHHASRTGSSRERSASARWPSCCCCVCACVNSVRCGGWGGAAGRRTSEEERGELGALYRLCGGADSAQRGTRLLAALAANLCPSSHRLRPRAPGRAPGGESCLLRHTLLHTSRDAHCQSRISRYTPEAVCGRSARMFMADRVGQAWVRW
jgi:hypothetical protein